MNRYTKSIVATVAAAAWLATGCGKTHGDGSAGDDSKVSLRLSGGDFTGNSVEIIGTRDPFADGKYRCQDSFDQCFDLSGTNPVVTVDSLCPSNDVPNGTWTFVYKVYSGPCAPDGGVGNGVVLNAPGNPNNFVCFDSHDLFSQQFPNETNGENLSPGPNDNSIACLTQNATKDFAFTSCAINSQSSTELSLDCGCVNDPGICTCPTLSDGPGGNLQANDAGTCILDPDAPISCSVICCATGLNSCSGVCVDLQTDPNNCGTCGNACPSGDVCQGGQCC